METNSKFSSFIEQLVSSDEYWKVNYYFRCLKKLPHGGVCYINQPNFFLQHFKFNAYVLFTHKPICIPLVMEKIVTVACDLFTQHNISLEYLLQYIFDEENWYVGMQLLTPRPEIEKSIGLEPIIWHVIANKQRFLDYFMIDVKHAIYALICLLIENQTTTISGIKEIVSHEILEEKVNKYGLKNITKANFFRQGFTIDQKYCLYNIFFDTSMGNPIATMPHTIQIIKEQTDSVDIYMRCDENLTVPVEYMLQTATLDAEKFHGKTIDFSTIQHLLLPKENIVHFDPESGHKIFVKINPGNELNGVPFLHFEVEELWNPSTIQDSIVTTNFVHAKYFPQTGWFTHIDFSVNQYIPKVFEAKYLEQVNETGIPIDKHADLHYKVWCIEGERINASTWCNLVYVTLNEPFRKIFLETVSGYGQ